jgi:ABC-type lipoprotein export system ATPase subunit
MHKIPKIVITSGKEKLLTIQRFSIEEGDSLLLQSEKPMGKTQFLHGLYRYYQISRKKRGKIIEKGDIYLWNIKKEKLFRKGNSEVILLEDYPAIISEMTVNQNILLPMKRMNIRLKHKLIDYLRTFELNMKQFNKGGSLTFSEKKIVELIRAVMQLPEIVLIDDFDLSFHENLHDRIFEMLSLLRKNGTIIIATGKVDNPFFSRIFTIKGKEVIEI